MSGLTEALLGQATTFTVDAAEAGEGTLELVVSTENNTVKAEVVACARGLYDVTFVPQTTSTHYVNISFNDDNVPGLRTILSISVYKSQREKLKRFIMLVFKYRESI